MKANVSIGELVGKVVEIIGVDGGIDHSGKYEMFVSMKSLWRKQLRLVAFLMVIPVLVLFGSSTITMAQESSIYGLTDEPRMLSVRGNANNPYGIEVRVILYGEDTLLEGQAAHDFLNLRHYIAYNYNKNGWEVTEKFKAWRKSNPNPSKQAVPIPPPPPKNNCGSRFTKQQKTSLKAQVRYMAKQWKRAQCSGAGGCGESLGIRNARWYLEGLVSSPNYAKYQYSINLGAMKAIINCYNNILKIGPKSYENDLKDCWAQHTLIDCR